MSSSKIYKPRNVVGEDFARLTFTKVEVIYALQGDQSIKEAADKLSKSKRTIDFHLGELYDLFGVNRRRHLFEKLRLYGMIPFEPKIDKDIAA